MPPLDPVLQARLDAFQNYKVKHPYLEAMDRLLSDAIGKHTSYRLLALYGPVSVFLTVGYLDFAHFTLKNKQHRQAGRGLSAEVK